VRDNHDHGPPKCGLSHYAALDRELIFRNRTADRSLYRRALCGMDLRGRDLGHAGIASALPELVPGTR
jgi:hypothetical protein